MPKPSYPKAFMPWSAEEDALIQRRRAEGHSFTVISRAMGRSAGSLKHRAARLKIGGVNTASRPWTPKEEAALARMCAEGQSNQDMARSLGRALEAIRERRRILHLPSEREVRRAAREEAIEVISIRDLAPEKVAALRVEQDEAYCAAMERAGYRRQTPVVKDYTRVPLQASRPVEVRGSGWQL